MKKTAKYILGFILALSFTQCSLDTDLYQDIKTEDAFKGVQDVQNAMNGAYERFGSYYFYGNYTVATSDFISDLSKASTSSGHFVAINQWTFDEYNAELLDMWSNGYKILDRCVRGINGGKALLAAGPAASDSSLLNSYLSQMYALRAMTSLVLVNYFGLPYHKDSTTTLGIVLVKDQPIKQFEQVSRATVHQTYAQILADIASAKAYMAQVGSDDYDAINQFYFNEAAIYALEARTKLYMNDFDGAKDAAQTAITLRSSGDETLESYVSMWKSTAITKEDIFTIAKSDNDNLSSNSLNTLYGSYKGAITSAVSGRLKASDIRKQLLSGTHPKKFDGTATSAAVTNIPVFRKSEMYLIIAEANIKGTTQDLDKAKDALFYTAKRDTATYKTVASLPATAADLTKMVMDERVRELFCEGHRYFDLRRTGTTATITGKANYNFNKWVFPIPGNEVDAGFGVVQNTNWSAARPQ